MARSGSAARCLAAGLTAAALCCFSGTGRAMEFTAKADDDLIIIAGRGDIRGGDAERLVVQLLASPRGARVALMLHSNGGGIVAGEGLAAVVYRYRLPVLIGPGDVCASACFLVFAASPHKAFFSNSRIGVHSASIDARETFGAMALTTAMARSASDFGVPPAIIGKMVTTPPDGVTWLSAGELVSMGGELVEEALGGGGGGGPGAPRPARISPPDARSGPSAGARPAAPAAPVSPGTPPAEPAQSGTPADERSPSFQQGRADRMVWERWFASLAGDARSGAEYWAGERGKQRPGECLGTPEFRRACLDARHRLTGPDARRKADPQYRWGWNSL